MGDIVSDFDGIVIGGGHNGLTCAAYLALAGARIAVVERSPKVGGGTSTSELTAPGFHSNVCANYFHGIDASPILDDLELSSRGFDIEVPEVQQAFLYSDGRAIVVHTEAERTAASIGRFSARDADEFLTRSARYQALRPLLVASAYNAPRDVPALAATATSQGLIPADTLEELNALSARRPYEVIDEAFEAEQLRVLLKKQIHVIQGTNAPGFGGIFPPMLANLSRTCMPRGGSGLFADTLAGIVAEHGGEVLVDHHVSRIVVDQGRAIGVEVVADGGEPSLIEASDFVVSAVDFPQIVQLAGGEHFPAEVRAKAEDWDWFSGHSLVTLHLALNEPPAYTAMDFDQDVDRAFNISFGADDSAGIEESMRQLDDGQFPTIMAGNGACNSKIDPSYAPEGKHVAFWWPFASYSVDGDPANWQKRRGEYEAKVTDYWRRYAPNLDDSNIIASYLRTPFDVAEENLSMRFGSVRMGPYTSTQIGESRPHPDLADYRVPTIAGLYHCGSSSPNGGGVNGAPGYSAAGVIADDVGLDRWWPRMTVERARALTHR
jgi:phytoene dehydrogenase-like protein